MHCPICKAEDLLAVITLEIPVPLAKKGGGIKTAGVPMTHQILKDEWIGPGKEKKPIRGPIVCPSCDAELVYVAGSNNPIQLASELEEGEGEEEEDED